MRIIYLPKLLSFVGLLATCLVRTALLKGMSSPCRVLDNGLPSFILELFVSLVYQTLF